MAFDSNQTYKIMSVRSGRVLDVPGGNIHGEPNIQQFQYHQSENQMWRIIQLDTDYYSISSLLNDGMCLEIKGAEPNAPLKLGNNQKWNNQIFKFIPVDGSQLVFLIQCKETSYVLAVLNASVDDHAGVVQSWIGENDESEQWVISPAYQS